jgi:hypothetical protein
MRSEREIFQVSELICRVLEGYASAEEVRQLEELLHHNPEVLSFYIQIADTLAELMCPGHSMRISYQAEPDPELGLDMHLWKLLAEEEKIASTVEISEPVSSERPLIAKVKPMSRSFRMNKFSVVSLITSAAALLFLVLFAQFGPSRPISVATLTDSFEVQWQNRSLEVGSRLTNRRSPLRLLSGYAKLQFDNGAEVIVQGPCDFQLENTEQMYLLYGKLTAVIPPEAVGFRVNTSVMSVVDLGTEFSVRVDEEGGVVNLYKGRASVLAGREGDRKGSQLMAEGQAMRVDPETQQIEEVPLDDQSFVRRLDSRRGFLWRGESINLADIVGGGNGLGTGLLGSGIDVASGAYMATPTRVEFPRIPCHYNPVQSNPFIDGVFVPDGADETVILNSNGESYTGFPVTEGIYRSPITHGPAIRDRQRFPSRHFKESTEFYLLELEMGGILYGTPDNPAIYMHTNVGITFDLDAIRSAYGNPAITHFESICGIPEKVRQEYASKIKNPEKSTLAVYMFLDDQHQLIKTFDNDSLPEKIRIPIKLESRFLTIAVVDTGLNSDYDWCLLGKPVLKFE